MCKYPYYLGLAVIGAGFNFMVNGLFIPMDTTRINKNIPIDLFAENAHGLVEQEWDFAGANGHGAFKKLVFKNIHICYGEIGLVKNHFVAVEFPVPVVELFFSVLGSSAITSKGGEVKVLKGNRHNMLFCPDTEYYVSTPESGEMAYSFHIVFPESYFSSMVNKAFPVLEGFKEGISSRAFSWLAKRNMPITPEMNSILREIIDCKRSGMLKCLFLESKIIKLLMLQLEQFEQLQGKKTVSLKRHDIDRIHHVKQLLEENISETISLLELAHRAGINDFKLKKGFKEVYGTTVHGYLNQVRMQEAKKLLLENNKTVAEIAAHCGYKFVQNFSTAFKQKYGVSPDKFRR